MVLWLPIISNATNRTGVRPGNGGVVFNPHRQHHSLITSSLSVNGPHFWPVTLVEDS